MMSEYRDCNQQMKQEQEEQAWREMMIGTKWNRCDVCGKFISMKDIESGAATRSMITPDSAYSTEDYETLCKEHTFNADFEKFVMSQEKENVSS